MKKASLFLKAAFLASLSLVLLGLTACGGKTLTREQKITDDFKSIDIKTDTSDLTLLPSEDGECKVVCVETEKIMHTATVNGKTLSIEVADSRNWFAKLLTPKMSATVYLPKEAYESAMLESDTGDITVDGSFSIESVNIESDTGKVTVEDIKCNALVAKLDTGNMLINNISSSTLIKLENDTGNALIGNCKSRELYVGTDTGKVNIDTCSCTILGISVDTGDIDLVNVIAEGKFDISSTTGDVKFTACDASSVFVTTDTGDVMGSFLTDKVIFADTDTGKVDIPKLTSGGKCEITTDTGDIKITLIQ